VELYPGIVAIGIRIYLSADTVGCLSVLSNLQLRDFDISITIVSFSTEQRILKLWRLHCFEINSQIILSRPVVLLQSKIEIISMISSLTQIFSSTLPPLSSKSGKVLFSSTLKEKFYTNINENLNEFKTINNKTYWMTINTLLKGESTMNDVTLKNKK
jgi:hypothetical protein